MDIYYRTDPKGQESAHAVRYNAAGFSVARNTSFDTNRGVAEPAKAPVDQAVQADTVVGRVVTNNPPFPTIPTFQTSTTPLIPGYLSLVSERLATSPKPRGWRAAKAKANKERFENLYSRKWVNLDRDEKLQQVFHSGLMSEAVAFSLNFSSARLERLMTSADPARVLSQELNRAARVCFGSIIPVAFAFDVSPDGDRLHIHGIAITPDFENETVNRLRQMLKRAGGVVHGLGGGRQCSIDVYHNAEGWRGYLLKDQARTVKVLGTEKITFVSRELTQIAQREHDANRALAKQRKAKRV